MNVLLTGATGLLGRSVLPMLLSNGYNLQIMIRKESRSFKGTKIILGDLYNKKSIKKAAYKADTIIHIASTRSNNPQNVLNIDVFGMRNLLECWHKCSGPFIYISSQSVYGIPKNIPISEDHPLDPTQWYGLGKLMCENALIQYAEKEARQDYLILRPPIFIDYRNESLHIIDYMKRALENQNFFFALSEEKEKESKNGSSWIDIEDIALIISKCLNDGISGIFNIASGYFTWYNLINLILKLTESKSSLNFNSIMSDFIWQNFEWRLCTKKIETLIGFHPQKDLEQLLNNIIINLREKK